MALTDPDDPNNGDWQISLENLAVQQIAERTDLERGFPTFAAASPQGGQLLLFDALFAGLCGAIDSPYLLLDLKSGAVEPLLASHPDEPHAMAPARIAYSPDGERLVFTGTGTQVDSGLY